MDTTLISVAFFLGFMGSLHCIGMCGGLVSAITLQRPGIAWAGLLIYQAGRILIYLMLGVLTALVGISLNMVGGFSHIQWALSLLAGLVMFLFALNLGGWMPDPLARLSARAMAWLGLAARIRSVSSGRWWPWFTAGMVNGFLPCGLVYAALALALGSGSPGLAIIIMAAFGLGTLPAMMLAPILMTTIAPRSRALLMKLLAFALIVLALFTVYRGNPWISLHQHHMQQGMGR